MPVVFVVTSLFSVSEPVVTATSTVLPVVLAVFIRPGTVYRWAAVVVPIVVLAASVALVPQWDRRVMMGGVWKFARHGGVSVIHS